MGMTGNVNLVDCCGQADLARSLMNQCQSVKESRSTARGTAKRNDIAQKQ